MCVVIWVCMCGFVGGVVGVCVGVCGGGVVCVGGSKCGAGARRDHRENPSPSPAELLIMAGSFHV